MSNFEKCDECGKLVELGGLVECTGCGDDHCDECRNGHDCKGTDDED